MPSLIKKETLQFLAALKENNDRDWFNANKERYTAAHGNFQQFVQFLINEASRFDKNLEGLDAKKAVFRIYRDTRFSKDKSPYKTNFGAWLSGRDTRHGIAGYYFHLAPGGSFTAGGVHMPESPALKTIRKEISANGEAFLDIINSNDFKNGLELRGEKLSKVPQGFEKDDPMAEYLKFKEILAFRNFSDDDILSDGFEMRCVTILQRMQPLCTFLNEAFS